MRAWPRSREVILIGIAVALLVPVILFTRGGFQFCLTLILAPLAALSLLRAPAGLRKLFILCLAAGLTSIALSSVFLSGPVLPRYVLSLMLILTPPLYFFLGRYLGARYVDFRNLLMVLAGVSAVFVLALATQVIATGEQVRGYIVGKGALLNVDFLGLPLYGSFGVLSVTALVVLEMFVIGAAYIASTRRPLQVLFLTGFGAAVFLVTGSNARGPQLALPYIVVMLGAAALSRRSAVRAKAAILLTVTVVSFAYTSIRMPERIRVVSTLLELLPHSADTTQPSTQPVWPSRSEHAPALAAREAASAGRAVISFDELSTGRESILRDTLREVASSPMFGNGFASFGRIDPDAGGRALRSGNRTAHLHYLTILWKGGLIFFLPYMILVTAFWLRALSGALAAPGADVVFLGAGLLFLFTILSATWDVLLVPSAGALAFFLLGAVSAVARGRERVATGPSIRLLFFGFLVRDEDVPSIFEGEAHPQYSALRFQHNLLKALEEAGASIEAITTPPIAPFPRNGRWWVPRARYQLASLRLHGRQIPVLNVPGVRLVMRLTQFVRRGLAQSHEGIDAILVYSVHTPLVAAALILSRARGAPVFVFIPDLPTFMGGRSHFVKRMLKRLDAAIVRRLLSHVDGAFPITEGIGRDWLAHGPKYWTMEGISDEAATVLSSARANGSYVFRGDRRPVLLYTGALEYVLTFAESFHRSPVDASLVFVGGGVEAARLQELAAVDDRIEVKPFMTGDSFAREVSRADFMVNPRDPAWPGTPYSFPSKLLEYLITGKPVVSTRLSGIPADYFGVFRPVDLVDQPSFESSLKRALTADTDPEAIWSAAERLAGRLSSVSVGAQLIRHIGAVR